MRYYYLGTLERGTATEDMGERIYPEKAPEHPAQLQYHSIWFSNLSTWSVGDLGWIPGSGTSREEGMATHSGILAWVIPMDRGAW